MVQPEQRRGARRPLYRQPHLPPPVATGGPCTGAHAHPRWSVACALPRRRLRGVYAAAARFGRPPYILAQSPLDVSPCPHGVHAHDDAHDVLAAALRALQRALLRATPPSFSELFSELLFSELLPRYTTLWPGQDACETCTRTRRRYRCARCTGRAPPVRSWYSLELVLLARMHASLWPAVHARTQELVRPDRFHCYRELHGGPGAFYPRILPQKIWPLRNYSELLLAAPRVRDFRLRVWARAGLAGGLTVHGTGLASAAVAAAAVVGAGGGHGRNKPEPPSILFVLRRESRVIVNEAALQAAVTAEAALRGVVQFVRMEDVGPLVAQIKLVARAAAIAGMHGQGLALLPLLPAHERPCALLELRSKRMGRQATHAGFDLMRWAMMSGVRYFVLKHQPDTAPCSEEDFRLCGNVTANVPEVVEALLKVWRHVHSDA